jgi:hypothetical protein
MLSLGGGQGNGTTDPSAHSDLTGREVGTRSAEPHDIVSPPCGDKPENSKAEPGSSALFQRLDRLNFQELEDETYVLVLG